MKKIKIKILLFSISLIPLKSVCEETPSIPDELTFISVSEDVLMTGIPNYENLSIYNITNNMNTDIENTTTFNDAIIDNGGSGDVHIGETNTGIDVDSYAGANTIGGSSGFNTIGGSSGFFPGFSSGLGASWSSSG